MKCYTVNGISLEGLTLLERPDPDQLKDHEVLIDIHAVSLNYRDLLVAKGLYGRADYSPFIPASDMAGVVAKIGAKVTEWKVGDRVLNSPFLNWPAGTLRSDWARTFIGGAGVDGVLAQRTVYPETALVKIPDHLNFEEGSTFTIAGLTAWASVVTHGKTRPGEWVLLHGTGGVSIFAAQIARMIGAKTILTTASDGKGRIARDKFGVHATVDYRNDDWPKRVREITNGNGVDVVVDVAGGATLARSLKVCNYGARVAVVGLLESPQSQVSIMDFIHHQVHAKGIFMESTEELRSFMKAVDASKLRPCIDRVFPFDSAKGAYEYLEAQEHIGKIVIKVGRSDNGSKH